MEFALCELAQDIAERIEQICLESVLEEKEQGKSREDSGQKTGRGGGHDMLQYDSCL
jgi:hypothetical protein